MKKRIGISALLATLLASLLCTTAYAGDDDATWTKHGNDENKFLADGTGIGVDRNGNSYVGGFATSGLDRLDENTYGHISYFVAKYSPAGEAMWFRRVGGVSAGIHGTTFGNDISVDSNGNSFITGSTSIGISKQQMSGDIDFFLAKYDATGKMQWTRQYGVKLDESQLKANKASITKANAVGVDDKGNSYVTGNSLITDKNDTPIDPNSILQPNCFLAKYSADGMLQWAKTIGKNESCVNGKGISVDSTGNSYVTGIVHSGSVNVDRRINYFVAKYNSDGELLWFKQAATADDAKVRNNDGYPDTVASRLHVDVDGNSFVTGYTNVGITSDSAQNGDRDAFVAKYDPSGNLEWTTQLGTAKGRVEGFGVSVDRDSNSYIVGSSDTNLLSGTKGDAIYFIAKYAPDGKRVSLKQIDKSDSEFIGRAISVDTNGYSYATGLTRTRSARSKETYFISKNKE